MWEYWLSVAYVMSTIRAETYMIGADINVHSTSEAATCREYIVLHAPDINDVDAYHFHGKWVLAGKYEDSWSCWESA